MAIGLAPVPNPARLAHILENAAKSSAGCTLYSQCACEFSDRDAKATSLSYKELFALAKAKAWVVASLAMENRQQSSPGSGYPIMLLHFDSMEDNIVWFWATILAGLKPAVSTPLPANPNQRKSHLAHLANLLEGPMVLTTETLLPELSDSVGLKISTIEHLTQKRVSTIPDISLPLEDSGPTILLLTSGSSGNAKAVELRPEQILASVSTKSEPRGNAKDVYLNWIGFDHVAAVVESHIRAMYLAVDQIHVPAGEVISQPWRFLSLIKEHRVSVTFAPHFFLARLLQTVENSSLPKNGVDLSCLHRIDSGGEAVTIWVVDRLMKVLRPFGARENLIRPVFGMTETCAGCIYNYNCPDYDIPTKKEFASLGTPIEGLKIRIIKDDGQPAEPNELGVLQLAGDVVFEGYYNNPAATANALTQDGWFSSGDRAFLDENGNLYLSGRDKDTINLNGVKYEPFEIEAALEQEELDQTGITPSFTSVFSVRPHNATSEEICVLYHPTFDLEDLDARIKASNAIVRIVGTRTRTRPKHIIPLPKILLPKSALGKLSRAKLRDSFVKGDFKKYEDRLNTELKHKREFLCEPPTTDMQKLVLKEVSAMLNSAFEDMPLGVNNSIFDFGITSTDLFVLAKRIQAGAELSQSIPVGTLLTDPTVRGIAAAVDELGNPNAQYVPLVPLQKEGSKTPLFLIHPGSGDVLAFVALAKYFPDRPVYGIRTKSLYAGQDFFKTVHEMADTYYDHIKRVQPKGPYAIAGYSLGSSVAFEIAKMLEREGESIPFVGALDSPPYIRELICDLSFVDVLLDVAYFLELVTEEYAMEGQTSFSKKSDEDALDTIMSVAPPDRLKMLSIDKPRLRQITQVTNSFGRAASSYLPEGMVSSIDVVWVTPLLWVASSRKEWMDNYLSKWVEFSKEAPRFHECEGLHSKMLNDDYVDGIAKRLRAAIQARGL